jgi:ketosteroid isomerase-like protein
VDEAAVANWLERYVAAWRSYDPDEIRALFAEDAVYRFHPWDEGADAVTGREAIAANWLETPDDPGSWTAEYRPWAVDGDRAVAVGESRYLATDKEPEEVFHNVFLLRFDEAGQCTEFTDVYMLRPA